MTDFPIRAIGDARREYAHWLRRQGFNFREIGERLGVSPAQAASMSHSYAVEAEDD